MQVIVFDGVCLLCSRWVRFVYRHDRRGYFHFAAMQSPRGHDLLLQHGLDPDDPNSLLLVDAEHGYVDSDAIIRIVTQFGGLWRLVSVLRIIPRSWRDAAYRHLARNRYKWFGRSSVCMHPSAEMHSRFLN